MTAKKTTFKKVEPNEVFTKLENNLSIIDELSKEIY